MSHPSLDELKRLLGEDLDRGERKRIEAHVNDCDTCLERLDAMQRQQPMEVRLLTELLIQPPVAVAERNGTAESGCVPALGAQSGWPSFEGYDLLEYVGGGGMGEIFKARHRRTNRVVALKTLAAGDPLAPEYRERLARFRTEAEAVGRLQHPHVVALYDVGEQDGRPYLTMEWVDGGSLAVHLAGTPQPERVAAEWVRTLARTVQHVHEQGVIHRDVKPANILLVGARSAPKLTDFGVAKLLDRSGPTQPLQRLGTPEYMAPEQAEHRTGDARVGPATDIYALGVLLYELLTGRPPFRADEPLETLRQVREDEPLPPRRLRPRLDRDLETITLKCLQKEPRRRYASAAGLADDLERWLTGRPILARPSGPGERAVRWARRHPERAVLLAVTIALLGASAVGLFWQWWAAQVGYTRQLAASADHQLLLVKYAVRQTAQETALRDLLVAPGRDLAALRRYLEATRREFARWFTRPGENPPIINWFVMDPQGTIRADSYEDPKSVGKNYTFRDYYAALVGEGAPADRDAVYVSRVYESEQDDRYKFTVITRVWQDDVLLGLVGASLAVDVRLAALDMAVEWPGARLAGPVDKAPRSGAARPEDEPAYVVVLDRDYAVPGQKPRASGAANLAAFAHDSALRESVDPFSRGGFLVTSARVGDSHFVALVERPYPWPIHMLLRYPLQTAVLLAGVVLVLVVARRWVVRHRPALGQSSVSTSTSL
jgi:eukaryotic-like serine/threonine-protein kinase